MGRVRRNIRPHTDREITDIEAWSKRQKTAMKSAQLACSCTLSTAAAITGGRRRASSTYHMVLEHDLQLRILQRTR